jgi:hypothetical protein
VCHQFRGQAREQLLQGLLPTGEQRVDVPTLRRAPPRGVPRRELVASCPSLMTGSFGRRGARYPDRIVLGAAQRCSGAVP